MQCLEVFFKSDGKNLTDRVYDLTAEQKQKLWSLFTAAQPDDSTLPVHGDKTNRVRVERDDMVFSCHIYRDRWERRVYDDWELRKRGWMKMCALDYLELDDPFRFITERGEVEVIEGESKATNS